ncbi:MAG: nicotinate-nucleotide--dimethylbenzimidazole phosphoribosyltransferase [Lachnospiraceae bacterium]|nr:nicotinate-nucleotide--dimethylbenzimidazole phosphoribosyltransferase [Lachnospiraceae bacterium]
MTKKELFELQGKMPDPEVYTKIKQNWDALAKPIDGLGVFEEIHCRIGAIRRECHPDLSKKELLILCADNGVVAEGVTQTGQKVTAQVASLMAKGKSTVGVMAKNYPLSIVPVDIGINGMQETEGLLYRKVASGTEDFLRGPAMTEEQCLAAIEIGMELVRDAKQREVGLVLTGEMGIGNTTTSTALFCALTGTNPEEVTGRGAGLDDAGLQKKKAVIKEALRFHNLTESDRSFSREAAFEALCRVGGLDLAGMAGIFLGGMQCGLPVVIDGLISAVAALTAELLLPGCKAFMIASHAGKEQGCQRVLKLLGLRSVIDAQMALGEGTGALLLLPMLDMVFALYEEGTDFADTEIAEYKRLG